MPATLRLNYHHKTKICRKINSVQKNYRRTAGWNQVNYFFYEGQKVFLTIMTEIECKTLSNFMEKLFLTYRQFNQKPQKFLSNNKVIFVDFSIKKSIKSKKSSNKTKLTKLKRIKNTKWNKNKWCQNFSGLKISRIKLMLKINKLWENMSH